uniref:Uncharacterized protein n=1 Tax=Trypanosoma congolense (strain IL3000) TaxID=1068625 RepID=G0UTE2_TRYCI|nr:hypothetical protein, unlikely [Trypanosoma congolense IL3000]
MVCTKRPLGCGVLLCPWIQQRQTVQTNANYVCYVHNKNLAPHGAALGTSPTSTPLSISQKLMEGFRSLTRSGISPTEIGRVSTQTSNNNVSHGKSEAARPLVRERGKSNVNVIVTRGFMRKQGLVQATIIM